MENEPIDKTHKISLTASLLRIGNWVMGVGTLALLAVSLIWVNTALFFTLCIPVGLAAWSIWDRRRCKKKYGKDWRRKGGWVKSDSCGD